MRRSWVSERRVHAAVKNPAPRPSRFNSATWSNNRAEQAKPAETDHQIPGGLKKVDGRRGNLGVSTGLEAGCRSRRAASIHMSASGPFLSVIVIHIEP